MSPSSNPTPTIPALATLPRHPYIDAAGQVAPNLQSCIGVYAIFDAAEVLQYIGYSRDIRLSLQQHLVRCPNECVSYAVVSIDRPDRPWLQAIQAQWIAEVGAIPIGNAQERARWEQAIDVRPLMSVAEAEALATADPLQQPKLLKQVARRVEADILKQLHQRSLRETLVFNPKLKESGRLDLK
jgi:hypothetical protein